MKTDSLKIITLLLIVFGIGLMTYPAVEKLSEVDALKVVNYNIVENDDFFRIRTEYPQFSAADRDFNDKVKNLIINKIAEFKQASQENWQARQDTASLGEIVPETPETPFDFIATWEHSQLNDKYISFVIKIYYFSGGAHGNDELYAFNYDVENRREITIMDFVGSTENLQKVSFIAKTQVAANLASIGWSGASGAETMLNEGSAPTAENYKDFNFNDNSLTVYFQKYQVAAGAVGSQQAVIYKNSLEEVGVNLDWFE
jgi:hypothetical protein